jgi:hypothetical protein
MSEFRGKYSELVNSIKNGNNYFDLNSEVVLQVLPNKNIQAFKKASVSSSSKMPSYIQIPSTKTSEEVKIPDIPLAPFVYNSPMWFKRKISSILKDNKLSRPAGNKRDGDLDMKHLYRMYTTGRVFTHTDIASKKQYNIALMVDCSGSMMHREKYVLASSATATLVKEFQDICNLVVVGFNTEIAILKPFKKKYDNIQLNEMREGVISRTSNAKIAYGNHDHYTLRITQELIKKQIGKHIILVLSDGRPSCDKAPCGKPGCYKYAKDPEYGVERLKEQINICEKQGTIVLGLGILSSHVESIYSTSKTIDKVENLYPAMVELLTKAIKRSSSI